jgi:hypothetical protein
MGAGPLEKSQGRMDMGARPFQVQAVIIFYRDGLLKYFPRLWRGEMFL